VNLSRCVARHLELVREVGKLIGSQVDSLYQSVRGSRDSWSFLGEAVIVAAEAAVATLAGHF
jgi:hypothetical protein